MKSGTTELTEGSRNIKIDVDLMTEQLKSREV